MAVKVGDAVRVVDREPTPADVKSGLFYNHFRKIGGTVERVYDDGTVCIDVDVDNLPEDISERHREIAAEMREKWLQGLSQEGRSKLTEADKQFRLRYKIVVASSDVEVAKATSGKSDSKPARATKREKTVTPEQEAKKETKAPAPKRPTLEDLEAAEQQFLEGRQKSSAKDGRKKT